jgi:hypothetical protein
MCWRDDVYACALRTQLPLSPNDASGSTVSASTRISTAAFADAQIALGKLLAYVECTLRGRGARCVRDYSVQCMNANTHDIASYMSHTCLTFAQAIRAVWWARRLTCAPCATRSGTDWCRSMVRMCVVAVCVRAVACTHAHACDVVDRAVVGSDSHASHAIASPTPTRRALARALRGGGGGKGFKFYVCACAC